MSRITIQIPENIKEISINGSLRNINIKTSFINDSLSIDFETIKITDIYKNIDNKNCKLAEPVKPEWLKKD